MNFGWGTSFGNLPSRFEEQYHCYSMAYAEKSHLEGGDKILLPSSALDTLARLQVDYPMLFRLQSSDKGTMTHCGVLEFSAPEGSCYIPYWMMQNLLIEEGSVITITNVSLPKATFVKLQPQHVDFLEITNPRAVLEHALRNFSCVTKGDVIQLPFNNKNYHFELKEVQPQDAACIIETDCNVDFDAPVGYTEPQRNEALSSRGIAGAATAASNSANNDSLLSTLANIPKQSAIRKNDAFGSSVSTGDYINNTTKEERSTSTTNVDADADADGDKDDKKKLKIVDGKIIRPDQDDNNNNNINKDEEHLMMASQTGGTGVQRNSAISIKAPQVDYWAVNAGDGARLDGKKPSILKDAQGNEVDVRKLRAEAAARRMEALANESKTAMPSDGGQMVNGKSVEGGGENGDAKSSSTLSSSPSGASASASVAKRKSRIGTKYSKLKQSGGFAFQGSSYSFKK